MARLEFCLICLTLAGLIVGGLSIGLVRGDGRRTRARLGRRLFVATLIGLGLCGLIGALAQAAGLAPLGLAVVFLMVLMLWETPEPRLIEGEGPQAPA